MLLQLKFEVDTNLILKKVAISTEKNTHADDLKPTMI